MLLSNCFNFPYLIKKGAVSQHPVPRDEYQVVKVSPGDLFRGPRGQRGQCTKGAGGEGLKGAREAKVILD